MIKKLPIIFLGLFVFLNIYAQKAVYQLPVTSETIITNPTFFYTLPKTAFKVDVVVTKISNVKGLYADYTEKMLGITNYCKENTFSYKLKNITVIPFTVLDETLQFVVELSSIQMQKNFMQTLYSNDAVLDFHSSSKLELSHDDFLPDFFKNYADVIEQQTYETYTETKIIDGIVTQIPVTQTTIITKTLTQQAQDAADFIKKIRDDRYAILSFLQEVTLDKEGLEYLVNQLNELEKKYLELFTGITIMEEIHEMFVVYPDNVSAVLPLFSVTPTSGFSTSICKTNAYNYYLRCTPQTSTEWQVNYYETITAKFKNNKNVGYRIRKAVPVFVTLVHGEENESLLGVFPIYQFGLLETLPANLNDFEIGKWGYIF